MIALSCSLCALIPQYLSQRSWVPNICCCCIQLINFVLGLPILHIVGAVIGLILLINIRSFPLVWHIRVMLPLGILRLRYHTLSFYHAITLQPSTTRHQVVIDQLESLCPVGANPFEFNVTILSWASPDETDWFGHVSNSNYAKARDAALSKFAITALPTFLNVGGRVALSSTHYRFLREISRFAKYEISLSIGAWDDKWLYLVCRFTSPLPNLSDHSVSPTEDPATGFKFNPRPARPERTTSTGGSSHSGNTSDSDDAASSAQLSYMESPNGQTTFQSLNCFTLSRVCFKIGRITVPPAIALSCEGFSKPPVVGSYSQRLPPPHWVYPHALRNASDSLDAYKRFLTGGWRDIPDADRWWVEALGGPIEERRRVNLAKFEATDRAMNGCMDAE